MMEQRSQMLKQMRLSSAERDREVQSHSLCLLCANTVFYQQQNNLEVIKIYYKLTNNIMSLYIYLLNMSKKYYTLAVLHP